MYLETTSRIQAWNNIRFYFSNLKLILFEARFEHISTSFYFTLVFRGKLTQGYVAIYIQGESQVRSNLKNS